MIHALTRVDSTKMLGRSIVMSSSATDTQALWIMQGTLQNVYGQSTASHQAVDGLATPPETILYGSERDARTYGWPIGRRVDMSNHVVAVEQEAAHFGGRSIEIERYVDEAREHGLCRIEDRATTNKAFFTGIDEAAETR